MTTLVVILAVVQLGGKALYSADDFLGPHNDARALVGVLALSWNDTLAAYARNYTNQLAAGSCSRLRRSGGLYGENLFWGSKTSYTAADAVAAWVSERRDYDHGTNSCRRSVCGHYTQVVWRASTSLGCARVECGGGGGGGGVVMVCEYGPRGNIAGERPY